MFQQKKKIRFGYKEKVYIKLELLSSIYGKCEKYRASYGSRIGIIFICNTEKACS